MRYKDLTKEIISYLALTGAITIAMTSPYFLLNIVKSIVRNRKYLKKKFTERKIEKLPVWDKKWRVVIFDIPVIFIMTLN